ncbi:MAG: PTS sugar transporter subunit IIA [Nitriliruptorales bacterium]|nr:PTS sugar transporter subunit IIA [Nitriliruptorales bacterium]
MADPLALLTADAVRLQCTATDRFDAVRQAGELLVAMKAVEPDYVEAMIQRERLLSSFVGEGFAIPHGTDDARALVRRAALAFLQFPDGIDWEGQEVRACVAIAAAENEHVAVMSRLARVLMARDQAEELRTTTDPERVLELLMPQPDDVPQPQKETL